MVEVLDRWREGGGVNRVIFRALLSGGVVADLARERGTGSAGGWLLVGVAD